MKARVSTLAVLGIVVALLAVFAWRADRPSKGPAPATDPAFPVTESRLQSQDSIAANPPAVVSTRETSAPSTSSTQTSPRGSNATTPPRVESTSGVSASSTSSQRPRGPDREAEADLDKIQSMLRDFRSRMGENPVGTNAEIMRRIMGRNPYQARLGPPEGQQLNERGELVDRWGSAYFFHQVSAQEMEVRSAGYDRQMYTSDDLVMK